MLKKIFGKKSDKHSEEHMTDKHTVHTEKHQNMVDHTSVTHSPVHSTSHHTDHSTLSTPSPTPSTHVHHESRVTSPMPVMTEANTQVLVQSTVATETSTATGAPVQVADYTGILNSIDASHSLMAFTSAKRQADIDVWGREQIASILKKTEGEQKLLLAEGEARALKLDDKYKIQLQQWVQQMDMIKAEQLKTLENELHGQQQNVLTAAKAQIHNIENEVNMRKMAALKEAQMMGASEIDQLSNLVSIAKLRPHTTTTVITTSTETGTVVAAAGPGPALVSGAATAVSVASTGAFVERHDGVIAHDHTSQHGTFRTENTVGVADVMTSTTAIVEKHETMATDKTHINSRHGSEPRAIARV